MTFRPAPPLRTPELAMISCASGSGPLWSSLQDDDVGLSHLTSAREMLRSWKTSVPSASALHQHSFATDSDRLNDARSP